MQRPAPPLPADWEGRWDPGQQRYFFINHKTKQTQWEDPRFQVQSPPRPQVNPYAAAASLSPSQYQHQARSGSRSPSPAAQAYQMQDMGSSTRSQGRTPRHEQRSVQQESSMSEDVDQSLVEKLHGEFPNTTKALIGDILVGCFNNEREAREQLNDLGFAIKRDTGRPSTSPARHTGNSSSGNNQQQQQPAAPKELTQLEKNRIHQQMSVAYPGASMDVIEMSMKVVKYDITKGKALLQRYLNTEEQKKSTGNQSSASGNSGGNQRGASASSAGRAVSPARTEPAGLRISSDNQPQGLSSGAGQIPTSSVAKMLAGSSGGTSTTQTREISAASTSSGAGRHQPTQYSSAKQVTKMSEHLLNTTSDLLNHLTSSTTGGHCCPRGENGNGEEGENEMKHRKNVPPMKTVITVQPRHAPRPQPAPTSTVVSKQGSSALGPDPSLRRGPDATLLSTDLDYACGPDLTLRNGPDKSLRAGPDKGLAFGPMGALGPDRSLRCGPEASLLGSNMDHSRLLVTEI